MGWGVKGSYRPRPGAEEHEGRVDDAELVGGRHQGLTLGGEAREDSDDIADGAGQGLG